MAHITGRSGLANWRRRIGAFKLNALRNKSRNKQLYNSTEKGGLLPFSYSTLFYCFLIVEFPTANCSICSYGKPLEKDNLPFLQPIPHINISRIAH